MENKNGMASAVPFLLFVGWQPTKSAQDSTIIFLSKGGGKL